MLRFPKEREYGVELKLPLTRGDIRAIELPASDLAAEMGWIPTLAVSKPYRRRPDCRALTAAPLGARARLRVAAQR